jgi:hypothetical protein
MIFLAWRGIEFDEGCKKDGQFEHQLNSVKWGTDYFIKCHLGKDDLYAQVADGQKNKSQEYIQCKYPSFKLDEQHPGREASTETSASLASPSILFKDVDSSYYKYVIILIIFFLFNYN